METTLPLATDSFSYSWLTNCNSITTNTSLLVECQNFNFDVSINYSPSFLAHADELFSDGIIKPVFIDPSILESSNIPNSTQTKPNSSSSSRIGSSRTHHHGFLTRWKTSTSKTLRRLLRYVKPLNMKVGCSRKSVRVDDIDKEEWQDRSWSSSQQASSKSVTVHPIGTFHDHENSIYEAVLHCKRSIEK